MTDLDALQAAAEAATPGPWEAESVVADTEAGQLREYGIVGVAPLREYIDSDPWHMALDSLGVEDATFIATANPAVVLELVAAHRAALARVENLREWVEENRPIRCAIDYGEEGDLQDDAAVILSIIGDAPLVADQTSQLDAALARIARVEALHPRIVGECHTCSDENGPLPWPCPTVRALTEGEPSE